MLGGRELPHSENHRRRIINELKREYNINDEILKAYHRYLAMYPYSVEKAKQLHRQKGTPFSTKGKKKKVLIPASDSPLLPPLPPPPPPPQPTSSTRRRITPTLISSSSSSSSSSKEPYDINKDPNAPPHDVTPEMEMKALRELRKFLSDAQTAHRAEMRAKFGKR